MSKSDSDEFLSVGGSTRIPKIQKLLSDYFNSRRVLELVHPDEADWRKQVFESLNK
jgi:L1 cell adhesion molecule like protein